MTPLGTLPDGTNIVDSIKRRLNVLIAATVALLIAVVIIGGYVFTSAQETHDALCTLRADLQHRVVQTQDFISHPDKYPGVKIDPKTLAPQLENQRRTVAALGGLGCS